MAKSSRGRGRGSSGTRSKNKNANSMNKSITGRKARRVTIQNCIRKQGRVSKQAKMNDNKTS